MSEVKLSPASSSESLEVEIVDEKPGKTAEDEEMMQWALGTLQRTQYLSDSESEDEEIQNKAFDLVRSRRVRRKPKKKKKKKKKVSWKNVGAIISQLTCDEPSQEKLPSQPARYEKTSEKTKEKRTLPRHDTVFLSCPAEPDELLEEGELKVEPSEDPLSLSAQPENTDVGCSSGRPCVVLASPDAQASQQAAAVDNGTEEQKLVDGSYVEDRIKDIKTEKDDMEEVETEEQKLVAGIAVEDYPIKHIKSENNGIKVDVMENVSGRTWGDEASDFSDSLPHPGALDSSRSSQPLETLPVEQVVSPVRVLRSRSALLTSNIPKRRSNASSQSAARKSKSAFDSPCSSNPIDLCEAVIASNALDSARTSGALKKLKGSNTSNVSRASGTKAAAVVDSEVVPHPLCKEGICGTCYQHLQTVKMSLKDIYPIDSTSDTPRRFKGGCGTTGSSGRRIERRDEDLCSICDKPPFGVAYSVVSHIVTCWEHQCLQCKWRYADKEIFGNHQDICVGLPKRVPNCVLCVMGPGCKNSVGFPFNISVKCPACELSFSVICELRLQPQLCIHRGIHLSVQGLVCVLCDERFEDKMSFNVHHRATHGVTEKAGATVSAAAEREFVGDSSVEDQVKEDIKTEMEVDIMEEDARSMWRAERTCDCDCLPASNALDNSSLHPSNKLRRVRVLCPARLLCSSEVSKKELSSWAAEKLLSALDGSSASNASDFCEAVIASSALADSGTAGVCSTLETPECVRVTGALDISDTCNVSATLDSSGTSSALKGVEGSKTSNVSRASGTKAAAVVDSEVVPHPLCKEGICGTCYQHLQTVKMSLKDIYPIDSTSNTSRRFKGGCGTAGSSGRRIERRDEDLCSICDKPPFGVAYSVVSHIVTCWEHQCLQCKWRYADKEIFGNHQDICVGLPKRVPNCVLCVMGPGCKNSVGFPFNISVKCPACELSFSVICELRLQSQLCIHRGIHLSVQGLVCVTCGSWFGVKKLFNVHQHAVHGATRKGLPHLLRVCVCGES